jgi:hypothetical protein
VIQTAADRAADGAGADQAAAVVDSEDLAAAVVDSEDLAAAVVDSEDPAADLAVRAVETPAEVEDSADLGQAAALTRSNQELDPTTRLVAVSAGVADRMVRRAVAAAVAAVAAVKEINSSI